MGKFYTLGTKEERPGVYQRYENIGGADIAGAINGVVATVIKSDWGPLNKVVTVENEREFNEIFGYGGTTDVVREIFRGGAIKVYVVRLGDMGKKGTAVLNDGSENPVINLSTKYEGAKSFSYIVRDVLGEKTLSEFILLEGTEVREKVSFLKTGGADALISAMSNSAYLDLVKVESYSGDGMLANVSQAKMKAGTSPEVTTEDYSDAFNLLEPFVFNCICVDTDDVSVHVLLAAFTNRIYRNGTMNFAVVGEPKSVAFETRLEHSKSYNDYNIVYLCGGWRNIENKDFEGYLGAARLAGMIAAFPSNENITRRSITGAIEPLERLTNDQIVRAIQNGAVVITANSKGVVIIEKGVTTLVSPEGEDDKGWKKIKRCKIRFEAFQRVSDTLEDHVAVLNNDSDGWAFIIQAIRGVLKEMKAEGKIRAGYDAWIDPVRPPEGESAWFVIKLDDVDSLENIYLNYQFRFSPNR